MRNLVYIIALVFVSSVTYAQDRNDLKGPEYKNYKVWENETTATVVYAETNKENLTGPEYKNQKAWENKSEKTYEAITVGSERSKLRGPAYKNYKPWRKDN